MVEQYGVQLREGLSCFAACTRLERVRRDTTHHSTVHHKQLSKQAAPSIGHACCASAVCNTI